MSEEQDVCKECLCDPCSCYTCMACDKKLEDTWEKHDCCECCGASYWCCVDECRRCDMCQQNCCKCDSEDEENEDDA